MIGSFKHRGLRRLWETGSSSGVQPAHTARLQRVLDQLDVATQPQDLNLPGNRFHELKGDRAGTYSVTISGNWRVTFGWAGTDATDVFYEDYH